MDSVVDSLEDSVVLSDELSEEDVAVRVTWVPSTASWASVPAAERVIATPLIVRPTVEPSIVVEHFPPFASSDTHVNSPPVKVIDTVLPERAS